MRMILAQFVIVGALVIGSSGTAVAQFDHPRTQAAKPVSIVSYAGMPGATKIMDLKTQLSDEERALIAFLNLEAAEERARH